jgi:hypothetical protein
LRNAKTIRNAKVHDSDRKLRRGGIFGVWGRWSDVDDRGTPHIIINIMGLRGFMWVDIGISG